MDMMDIIAEGISEMNLFLDFLLAVWYIGVVVIAGNMWRQGGTSDNEV